jgi:hypothetical protein
LYEGDGQWLAGQLQNEYDSAWLTVLFQNGFLGVLVQDLPNFVQGPRMFGKRKTPFQNSQSIAQSSIDSDGKRRVFGDMSYF